MSLTAEDWEASATLRGGKMEPTHKCQKLLFLKWPFELGFKSKSVPVDQYVKKPNFTGKINMFTVSFWSPATCLLAHQSLPNLFYLPLGHLIPNCKHNYSAQCIIRVKKSKCGTGEKER